MKTSHAIFAIVLGTTTFAIGNTALASSDNGNDNVVGTQTDNWLAIPAIYDKLTNAGYSDIYDIEREKDRYEIKAANADGKRVKLYVDPVSGEVLDTRSKSDMSKKDRYSRSQSDMPNRDRDYRHTRHHDQDGNRYNQMANTGSIVIHKVKREKDRFVITAANASGEMVELYMDPMTGDVLHTGIKSDMTNPDRDSHRNERRDQGGKRYGDEARF